MLAVVCVYLISIKFQAFNYCISLLFWRETSSSHCTLIEYRPETFKNTGDILIIGFSGRSSKIINVNNHISYQIHLVPWMNARITQFCLKDTRFRRNEDGNKVILKSTRRILEYWYIISISWWCRTLRLFSMKKYVKNSCNSCLGYLYFKGLPEKVPGSLNPIEKQSIPIA